MSYAEIINRQQNEEHEQIDQENIPKSLTKYAASFRTVGEIHCVPTHSPESVHHLLQNVRHL